MSEESVQKAFSDLKILSVALLLASLIVAAAVLYTGNSIVSGIGDLRTAAALGANTEVKQPAPKDTGDSAAVPEDTGDAEAGAPIVVDLTGEAIEGSANAPITIVEFSDFQCPYCARFYEATYAELKTNYIDTGKVKVVFKQFPLSFHQYAQKAAEASECASDQGKFWEMHDKLFENQDALDVASLKGYAKGLGLNTADFNSCLDDGKKTVRVQAEFQQGVSAGVRGTPSFVINGKLLVGAQPYEAFQQIIDAELAG